MANDNESIYYETYREDDEEDTISPRKKLLRTTGRVLGLLLVAAILGVCFWRMWMMKEPSSMTDYLWTDAAAKNPPAEYLTQNLDQTYLVTDAEGNSSYVKRSEYYTPGKDYDGIFKVSAPIYTPSLSQFQVSFRYSDRTLADLLRDQYGIFADTSSTDYPFAFALMTATGELITEYNYTVDTRGFYHYRRMVFENVTLDLPEIPYHAAKGEKNDPAYTEALYLNIYYTGVVIHPDKPLVSMVIYDGHLERETIELSPPPAALPALQPGKTVFGN